MGTLRRGEPPDGNRWVRVRMDPGLLFPFLLVAAILGGCVSAPSRPAPAALRDMPRKDRVPLMVLNFRNVTLKDRAPVYDPWEFGIPSMMITDLESVGIFNILSWHAMKDILEQQAFQSLGVVEEKEAVAIGKIAAARYILTGTFLVMDGNLRIESKLYSVESGTLLGAVSVSGGLDRFFELEKRLVFEMTSHMGAMLSPEETSRLARNVETTSVTASLDNYAGELGLIQAEEQKRKGNPELARKLVEEARARFQEALQHDPGYQRARKNLAGLTLSIPKTL